MARDGGQDYCHSHNPSSNPTEINNIKKMLEKKPK